MNKIHYAIISPDMVWQWYYDDLGAKHFKEILGKEANKLSLLLKTAADSETSGVNVTFDADNLLE